MRRKMQRRNGTIIIVNAKMDRKIRWETDDDWENELCRWLRQRKATSCEKDDDFSKCCISGTVSSPLSRVALLYRVAHTAKFSVSEMSVHFSIVSPAIVHWLSHGSALMHTYLYCFQLQLQLHVL